LLRIVFGDIVTPVTGPKKMGARTTLPLGSNPALPRFTQTSHFRVAILWGSGLFDTSLN
jgi:hypothetical protein